MNIVKRINRKVEVFFGKKYLNNILLEECMGQHSIPFNERAIEYSFVFRQLGKYCPASILDVGTGLTALPKLMQACNFSITAIDNVKDYWPAGMINRHFLVQNDDITNTRLTSTFKCITCISTLEHIVEFDKAVSNMCNLLDSGGILIASFPYNEKRYCGNVYMLEESRAAKNFPFITQSFSRVQVDKWCNDQNLSILEQEYWAFFEGEYWSTGERLDHPQKS
jgi:2-polyprenyl-3-methyl-5-hydroxy-6-metoxy-1,4-benzoquinol methylase